MATEIVETAEEATALALAPLLVLRPLEEFLDSLGLGAGPAHASKLGEGHSNVTFLVERDGWRGVLRRPPRPPLPPSAHDMSREVRVQRALASVGGRVPNVIGFCDNESVLGVPFYVMDYAEGDVITGRIPRELDLPEERRRVTEELIDTLVEIHAVDWRAVGLEGFGKPDGYNERQVRRFAGLWGINKTRDLPRVVEVAGWLAENVPQQHEATVVHGDYRLGNVMYGRGAPARIVAVMDWELSTIGDPLADLGYLIATYSEPGAEPNVLHLTTVTQADGFPSRAELAERYAEQSGRSVSSLAWYEALALWKSAVFCEAIYGRYLRGERGEDDPFGQLLEYGVPQLADAAADAAART